MSPSHSVVVLSGGLDSTVALALHVATAEQVTAVTFDYGQRHRHREISAATRVARHYPKVDHVVVDLVSAGRLLGGSALTDPSIPVPEGHYAAPSMAATVVPNRNAILANIAVGVAVARKADTVVLGVHAGDHPIYPDCRPIFIDALNLCVALAVGEATPVRIDAPFLGKAKADIVIVGEQLAAPMGLTWSCYQGGDTHCGRCGTCVERREAFQLAEVPDPTEYLS